MFECNARVLNTRVLWFAEYDPNVYPQIMHVFQSAAMRFGHTLVPPGVYRRRWVYDELTPINRDRWRQGLSGVGVWKYDTVADVLKF